MSRKSKALVLTGFGINCEKEMQAALELAGGVADVLSTQELFAGKKDLFDYDILAIPGGFAFGDDLGAGRVLANKLKFKRLKNGERFYTHLKAFVEEGRLVIGICNGFQMLTALGLLPALDKETKQTLSLVKNHSGKFEDRWVSVKVPENAVSPFLEKGRCYHFPVRHGEGRLIGENVDVLKKLKDQGLVALQYLDSTGSVTENYPENPNGSVLGIAGITNKQGNVIGMMPHPEANLSLYNHPNWGQLKANDPSISEEGDGLAFFKTLLKHLKIYESLEV